MKKNAISSLFQKSNYQKRQLWQDAIKWPLYSIAVMPVVLAAGWKISQGQTIALKQFVGFLIGSIFLLLWENLTNDIFDSETGVDEKNKPHSVVTLIGRKKPVQQIANAVLLIGLGLMYWLALNSSNKVFYLVFGSCFLGYLYQGPPFRFGYKGLGEPLCWIAFGPLATAAGLLVLSPDIINQASIPWKESLIIGNSLTDLEGNFNLRVQFDE